MDTTGVIRRGRLRRRRRGSVLVSAVVIVIGIAVVRIPVIIGIAIATIVVIGGRGRLGFRRSGRILGMPFTVLTRRAVICAVLIRQRTPRTRPILMTIATVIAIGVIRVTRGTHSRLTLRARRIGIRLLRRGWRRILLLRLRVGRWWRLLLRLARIGGLRDGRDLLLDDGFLFLFLFFHVHNWGPPQGILNTHRMTHLRLRPIDRAN